MKKTIFSFFLISLATFFLSGFFIEKAEAQSNSITFSVTPPLIQLSVEPGGRWASSVKIVNGGKSNIDIYATPVNFEARGEGGLAKFVPIIKDDRSEGMTSAEWIDVRRGPYSVPAESGVNIPFMISVPEDASPGGHYSALLIGTEPVNDPTEGSVVRVSSLVTSLILMRVEGDVIESGFVREFRTDAGWYKRPEAGFMVNFQNDGTVHLRPRGVIEIYNMWGKSRGTIPINTGSQFGNVLPDSSRSFSFRWEGEGSLLEAGRYTANLTMVYGTDGSRSVSETVNFWVLPIIPLLVVLSITVFLILIFVGFIRFYVKRVLAYEKKRLGIEKEKGVRTVSIESLKSPIRDSVIDMKKGLKEEKKKGDSKEVLWKMISRYRLLVFVFLAVVFLAFFVYLFISAGTSTNFDFKIFEEHPVEESESEFPI